MTIKANILLLFFALVFATFATQGAGGEKDCYAEKERFKHECNINIKMDQNYVRPSKSCCRTMRSVDMACVCRTISSEEKELSFEKNAFLSMACNNSVPVGNKCGGKYVNPIAICVKHFALPHLATCIERYNDMHSLFFSLDYS